MTRFIRNIDGAVHSVADDFTLPTGWSEASEADASPALLGTGEPAAITPSLNTAPGAVDPRVIEATPTSVEIPAEPTPAEEEPAIPGAGTGDPVADYAAAVAAGVPPVDAPVDPTIETPAAEPVTDGTVTA